MSAQRLILLLACMALQSAVALLANPNVAFKGVLQRQSTGRLTVQVNGLVQTLPVLVASGRFTAKSGHAIDTAGNRRVELARP